MFRHPQSVNGALSQPTRERRDSGPGPSPMEIARGVEVLLREAQDCREIWDNWWSHSCESIEANGLAWIGREAMEAKQRWFEERFETMAWSSSAPLVGAETCSFEFELKTRLRKGGGDVRIRELGVFEVQDGKVVRERFQVPATDGRVLDHFPGPGVPCTVES